MRMKHGKYFIIGLSLMVATCVCMPHNKAVAVGQSRTDLSGATIVVSADNPVQGKAADMLSDEVFVRTGIRLALSVNVPGGSPAIVLGSVDAMPGGMATPAGLDVPQKAEGYAIWVDKATGHVCLAGRDDRGVLFAAGRLLRLLCMRPGEVTLAPDVSIATAPKYPIRGHELGYRNKSNTYDAWSVDQYEQYLRDLAVFGSNMIQMIYDHHKHERLGPHMTEPTLERCAKLATLWDSYGLDVWVWMPIDEKLADPNEAAEALEARRHFFESVSPLTAVFVPRGSQKVEPLLAWMGQLAEVLREVHPDAQLWLSSENESNVPSLAFNETLFDYLKKEQPTWLTGAVFDTWQEFTLKMLRERLPEQYPISRYADITHSIECQYPVPSWDRAFAQTLGREGINPRPEGMAHIFRLLSHYSVGFDTYSDGVNDDVNKFIWNALGWDEDADLRGVLREYGRYFVGEDYGDAIADGLLALERNWEGPLAENEGVEKTLDLWQSIEKKGGDKVQANWRFQMGLYRAYYDAYLQRKLAVETRLEQEALSQLARAPRVGALRAAHDARDTLGSIDLDPPAPKLRQRIEELGEDLFKSIGMQLSVNKYGASNWERGATLDALDRPLNNRRWLEWQIADILVATDQIDRMKLIDIILNWEDPGPGGFYDDLGDAARQPHLVNADNRDADPGFVESPQCEHNASVQNIALDRSVPVPRLWRQSWLHQAQTLYYTPLRMRYTDLDPNATYKLRVVYAGRFRPTMRLLANGKYEIHDWMGQPGQPTRLDFEIPAEATKGGVLDLEWQRKSGRGPQVAEAWLIRQTN
jgi:hypothetical protein